MSKAAPSSRDLDVIHFTHPPPILEADSVLFFCCLSGHHFPFMLMCKILIAFVQLYLLILQKITLLGSLHKYTVHTRPMWSSKWGTPENLLWKELRMCRGMIQPLNHTVWHVCLFFSKLWDVSRFYCILINFYLHLLKTIWRSCFSHLFRVHRFC